jgi:hypothetical protein
MAYTIQRQARRLGPYDLGQVRVLAQAGEVSGADLVWREGSPIPTTVAQLLEGGATAAPAQSSETEPAPTPAPPVHDAFTPPTSSEATFKKGSALTSLFLAALGLIPVVGLFCAIPAIFFGIKGLGETKSQPRSRERMHAMVGVFVGGFLTLMYVAAGALFVLKRMKE